ncbi:TPA: hypothetical protein N0F65_001084 [Lagenidium giganteum]|uniref:Uncharacterized protein n=1 Tax=Lagenidium giganteum TaxID=4803 RepID=A0AAV2YLI2_9STRA|nr:TPA: hypothetical protein N0F65_001084 [Lagenidium giganteum]
MTRAFACNQQQHWCLVGSITSISCRQRPSRSTWFVGNTL